MHMLIWIGLFGLLAALHSNFIAVSHQVFAQARAGYIPKWFSQLHPKFGTPCRAIIVITVIGIVLVLNNDRLTLDGHQLTDVLMQLSVLAAMTMNFLTMLSLFKLRKSEPDMPRPYKAPCYPWIRYIALVGSGIMLVGMLISQPIITGIFCAVVIIGFIPFYYTRQQREKSPLDPWLESAEEMREEQSLLSSHSKINTTQ